MLYQSWNSKYVSLYNSTFLIKYDSSLLLLSVAVSYIIVHLNFHSLIPVKSRLVILVHVMIYSSKFKLR